MDATGTASTEGLRSRDRAVDPGRCEARDNASPAVSKAATLIREVREGIGAAHPPFPGRLPARYAHAPLPTARKEGPWPATSLVPRHVVEARYLGDYKVWLEFNDGRKGVVDLSDELHGEQREPLRDRELFAEFYLDYGLASIAWLDGVDFAPEFLYERLKEMH